MDRRFELHDELKELLGTTNCYFQPPESLKLKYPCYVYRRAASDRLRADNLLYRRVDHYDLTYITLNPDDPLIHETEDHFSMCSLTQFYAADGLNHYHYDLYY